MAKQKPPIYVLPHGIEVIGEYAPTGKNRYWRVRIREHAFFPDAQVVANGICVRRSRVVLASKLGRALTASEHAHHEDEDRDNDKAENIESLSPAEHNRHHKTGTKHSDESKARIGDGLRIAIADGRRLPPPKVDWTGRKHRPESIEKISDTRKERIASGAIAKPIPPSGKGRVMSESSKEKIRQAKLVYYKTLKGIQP